MKKGYFWNLDSHFGFPLMLQKSEKTYFLIKNEDRSSLKIITSINKNIMGQVMLRAMPVKDEQIGTFVKYISGESEAGKKNKI